MKSRHAVKQGLRCLHGVMCLKLWIHYSSNLVKRQQLRERGQEPIKTEYSRQGRFQQGMLHRSGFCSKILNFPKSRARKIERKTALLREQRQRDSKTDSGNHWSRYTLRAIDSRRPFRFSADKAGKHSLCLPACMDSEISLTA